MLAKSSKQRFLVIVIAFNITFCFAPMAFAQRGRGGGAAAAARPAVGGGGGGARPSLGQMGSGGVRPSPPSLSQPAVPQVSRPTPSPLPANRPSLGNSVQKPAMPNMGGASNKLPSIGSSRPSLGGSGSLPASERPTTRPATPNAPSRPSLPNLPDRPSINLPPQQLPTNKLPPGQLPTTRPAPLPGVNTKPPSLGNVRPSNKLPEVTTRPGNGINPPNLGAGTPTTLPGNINRPNINRPIIGGNTNINRPSINGNTNININNNFNIGNNNVGNRFPNRPSWDVDPGFSRPNWGLGVNDWHYHWHTNCINNHHYWYNGCWHGHWSSSWYAPIVWGSIGWGLGSMTSSWGVTYSAYYNPYYIEPRIVQLMPYNYSQPVVINNYTLASPHDESDSTTNSRANAQQEQALLRFDQGLAKFKSGDYTSALKLFDASLKDLPGDPVVHEVRCLTLFAIGDYTAAAAGLNSLLASAPGMDWTTMAGLYGSPDDYQTQLRALEQYSGKQPQDASAHFVLAYHYLVTDSKDAAIRVLQRVVEIQPRDITAKRMLDAMVPPVPTQPPASEPAPKPTANNNSETDLVGTWLTRSGDTEITLSITEDSQFTWTATTKNQAPIQLTGQLTADSEGISLETESEGTIGGSVVSKGPNQWSFSISGAPASAPPIEFERAR